RHPMPETNPDSKMTRRAFHARAARAAAALVLTAAVNAEANEPAAPEPEAEASPPDGLREAVARVRAAVPHLPEGDLAELERQVKGSLELKQNLQKHKVADGAEPAFVF